MIRSLLGRIDWTLVLILFGGVILVAAALKAHTPPHRWTLTCTAEGTVEVSSHGLLTEAESTAIRQAGQTCQAVSPK